MIFFLWIRIETIWGRGLRSRQDDKWLFKTLPAKNRSNSYPTVPIFCNLLSVWHIFIMWVHLEMLSPGDTSSFVRFQTLCQLLLETLPRNECFPDCKASQHRELSSLVTRRPVQDVVNSRKSWRNSHRQGLENTLGDQGKTCLEGMETTYCVVLKRNHRSRRFLANIS